MTNPVQRLLLSAGLTGCLVLAAPAAAIEPTVQRFNLGNPHSHADKGLHILEFLAASRNGRTTGIQAEDVFGEPNVMHAAVVVQLDLFCDPGFAGSTDTQTFYITHGRQGFGGLHVKHSRFSFRGTAFDGRNHQGKIAISGKFTRRGRTADGTVRVFGPSFQGAGALDKFTNCDTEPGAKPANRGKPYKWHIQGAF